MSAALTGNGGIDGSSINMVGSGLGSAQMGSGSVRDNRWLTLEVCREFQRSKCSRSEQECKYAHPPAHVEVQNGRVMCCFDSIKGKCHRKDPPCKYLHPPAHLKEQLLQNGRNNLVTRNMVMQQMQLLQQLSASPAATSSVPVMYSSTGSLASAQQAVLTSTNSLYPSAYLGAAALGASLNGSPSPNGAPQSTQDAYQSALLGASTQQSGANASPSNQLIAAILGQLAAGSASSANAASLNAQHQQQQQQQQQHQQQQYRALQIQLLQAAAQKQLLAASGYGGVAPTASSPTMLSGGASLAGLQGGVTLSGMQGTMGYGSLQNSGLAMHGGAASMSHSNANGVTDPAANSNSANALLQSLSTYAINGPQQRSNSEWATLSQLDFRSPQR